MRRIAESTVRRLSQYLRFLEEFEASGVRTISSEALASRGGATSAQVRKDLSFFGSFGKRGLGYSVSQLVARLRDILGLEQPYRVVVVGAGKIGSALAHYRGFSRRGFHVAAVYDVDPRKISAGAGPVPVRDVRRLERDLAAEPADLAIVSTPPDAAQEVVERLVRAGVRAILNFAPVQLTVPAGVAVNDVDMALELEVLSYELRQRRARAGTPRLTKQKGRR
jgi:redox-sensing transcriptional repressor